LRQKGASEDHDIHKVEEEPTVVATCSPGCTYGRGEADNGDHVSDGDTFGLPGSEGSSCDGVEQDSYANGFDAARKVIISTVGGQLVAEPKFNLSERTYRLSF
jgi:hypothetical protein